MTLGPATEDPPLGGEDILGEAALWQRLRSDNAAAARARLFDIYFEFARRLARRHFRDRRSGDIEFADLSQLAAEGLLEAIDRYDPEVGAPFRAFAARRIRGNILSGIAKLSEQRDRTNARRRAGRERVRSLMSELPASGDALDALTELAVGLAIGFILEDNRPAIEPDIAPAPPSAYDSLAWKETVARVAAEVSRLPPNERTVVEHHYLRGLTLEQIGQMLDVSKGRVSQIHRAALERLRKRLGAAETFRLNQ